MPIYDFRCKFCDATIERSTPSTTTIVREECSAPGDVGPCAYHRILSAPVVQVAMKDRAVCPPLRRYDGTE